MQWCAASRESNRLASGRVTHLSEQHTTRSSTNRAVHIYSKEQVRPDMSHWKLKSEENLQKNNFFLKLASKHAYINS
jgi:hypothetical protein